MQLSLDFNKKTWEDEWSLWKEKERVEKENSKSETIMHYIAHNIFMQLSKKFPLKQYDHFIQKVRNILDIKHNSLLIDIIKKNNKYLELQNEINKKKSAGIQIQEEISQMRTQSYSDFRKAIRETEIIIKNQYLKYLINEKK